MRVTNCRKICREDEKKLKFKENPLVFPHGTDKDVQDNEIAIFFSFWHMGRHGRVALVEKNNNNRNFVLSISLF